MKLRRDGPGFYVTLDGRYRIERQEYYGECSHPLCYPLHNALVGNGEVPGTHEITYYVWIVWDNVTDDYAGDRGVFDTKRDAVTWLETYLGQAS